MRRSRQIRQGSPLTSTKAQAKVPKRTPIDPNLHGAWAEGPADSQCAVLCLHGFGGTPAELWLQREALVKAGYYCVCPVIPGHVGSPEDLLTTTWEERVAAVQQALDTLSAKYDEVYVVGFSMGGALALDLAARNLKTVRAVATISAPLRVRTGLVGAILPLLGPLVARVKPWYPTHDKMDMADPDRVVHIPSYDRIPLAAVVQAAGFLRRLEHDLRLIEQPVLSIHGQKDRTIPPSNADLIGRNLVGSKYISRFFLPEAGHGCTVDTGWEELNYRVVTFFASVRGVAPPAREAPLWDKGASLE